MKIVLVTNYWKKSHGGGVETFVTNLVYALETKACDVNVIFREGNDLKHFKGKNGKISIGLFIYRQLCRLKPDGTERQRRLSYYIKPIEENIQCGILSKPSGIIRICFVGLHSDSELVILPGTDSINII